MKDYLVKEIQKTINLMAISQKEASLQMNISQPKLSSILGGNYDNISVGKLMNCLIKLGYDIQIVVTKSNTPTGRIIFTPSD